jgi:hypothetical protein
MEAFAERSTDSHFRFSWLQFYVVFLLSVLIGVTLGVVLQWYIGLAVGGGLFILQYAILGKTRFTDNVCINIFTKVFKKDIASIDVVFINVY